MLRLPPTDGDTWETRGWLARSRSKVSKEKIKVPAGEFEAFKVVSEVESSGKTSSRSINWFARHIGPVKFQHTIADGRTWVFELQKFTPAK
jgi:hypothetical protein